MKLKAYQMGGGLVYSPSINNATGVESRKTTEDDPKLDPLDKEIIGLMKDQNLLPSDIQMITNALVTYQRTTQHLGSAGSSSYRLAMPGMLKIMNMVSQARFNKGQWDNAVSEMRKHEAGSEVALDSDGRIFVMTKDGVKKMSASEYDPKSEDYALMSNSQLLHYRERNAGMDGSLLDAFNDVIGMKDIYQSINEIIGKFGTIETKTPKMKMAKDLANDLMEGVYDIRDKYSKAQINDFTKLVWDKLPENAQRLLAVKSKINPNFGSVNDFIKNTIFSNTSIEHEESFNQSATKEAGLGHSAKQEQLTQNNYLIQVGNLQGTPTRVDVFPRAAKINERGALNAQAYTFGQVIDRNEKPIDKMSVANMLKEGWAFAAGVPGSITFGNKLMSDHELEALLFDDQSNLTAVMLPYKNENGHLVPDFDLYDKFNQLQIFLDDHKGLTPMEITTKAMNLGLDPKSYKIEADGTLVRILDTMAFLTVSAYAGDDTIDLDKNTKRFLEKVDNRDGQHLKDVYNNMVMYGKLRPAKQGNVAIKGYAKSEKGDF